MIQTLDHVANAVYNVTLPIEYHRQGWAVPATGAAIEIAASTWLVAGVPGCATGFPATGSGETCDRTTPGALPMPAAAGGETIYVQSICLAALAYALFKLYDRLFQCSGLNGSTITPTEQTINGVALPARGGTGEGVLPFVEVYAVTGTPVSVNVTFRYVNQSGNTVTSVTTGVVMSTIGRYIPLNLAPGDTGVRQVLGATLSGATGGTVNWGITLARFINLPSVAGANWAAEPKNAMDQGGMKIDDLACLFVVGLFGTLSAATAVHGGIYLTRG